MNEFKPISLKIETEQELNSLMALFDAAARHGGVQAATPVAVFLQKLEAARIAAQRDEAPDLKAVA